MAKKSLTIQVTGVKEAFSKITTNFKKASDEIDMEMGDGVEGIITQAKTLLPAQYGRLRSSLNVIKISKFNYRYGSSVDYAAYVEFGTGNYAAAYVPSLESEWQKLAISYKTTGKGTLPKSPYLYPSTIIGQRNILKNIKATIKRYV
jgi:hypothetical protein